MAQKGVRITRETPKFLPNVNLPLVPTIAVVLLLLASMGHSKSPENPQKAPASASSQAPVHLPKGFIDCPNAGGAYLEYDCPERRLAFDNQSPSGIDMVWGGHVALNHDGFGVANFNGQKWEVFSAHHIVGVKPEN